MSMTKLRNLVACLAATVSLVAMPLVARADSYRSEPRPRVPGIALIEYPAASRSPEDFQKVSTEKSGNVPAKDGGALRLSVQLGDVRVLTDASSSVSYRAVAQADKHDPGAQEFLRRF